MKAVKARGAIRARCGSKNYSYKTVSKDRDIKVHDQADVEACEPEICRDLARMNRRQSLNGFELDEHALVHDEIGAISNVNAGVPVDQGNDPFSDHR